MIIIPIGLQCINFFYKKELNKSTAYYPFDTMFAPSDFVYEMLILLLEKNIDIKELVENYFFLCDKRASCDRNEHFYTNEWGICLYNTKYNVIFPHDDYTTESINKYIRRFERLKETILYSDEKLYFMYTSQSSLEKGNYTINGNKVINNTYTNLSNIYKLIGKYRSNYEMVVFDSINEEDTSLLYEKIELYKLNSCDCCKDLILQMNSYSYLFTDFSTEVSK
jgi:hypothetical protein